MPKRRNYSFKQLQGSSSSKPTSNKNGNDINSPSVNERLSDLRKLEGKDAAAQKRQLADSVNLRSVPPEVRGILGVPDSAPPRPKVAGLRTRERLRTPGPAPPKSWLAGNSGWPLNLAMRGARRGMKKGTNASDRSRPKQLLRFSRLTGLVDDGVDMKPSSLIHITLKTVAKSWDSIEEEDYPALAEIPLRLRLKLISYIGFYGPPLDLGELQALLQGSEDIQHLDLAGLVGHGGLTLKKIMRLLDRRTEMAPSNPEETIAESWDANESFEAALRPTLQISRFSQLTHLCLSHPAPSVLWRDLLALSKATPQVTHLSLAYWPRPTLTPNLATASVTSQHSPDVTAGGSHYYSTLDEDMTEPASLLRQLSGNLLCLQWLDLESCQDWIPALIRLTANVLVVPNESQPTRRSADWTAGSYTASSVFSSNWKQLRYIRCAQGWLPSLIGIQSLQERDASAVDRLLVDGIVKYLREQSPESLPNEQTSHDMLDVEKKRARMWLQCEYKLTYAGMRINSARRSQGCKPIGLDFGWVQRHVAGI